METPIQKFYKGLNVFITGGTGFMGKILIEKLLRSTEIETIYLLVREKKGKNVHVRIDELFEDPIFDRLKSENSKYKHKVEAIAGDCALSGLGLDIRDRQTLTTKIDVVFHVAATVRFDENLRIAYNINVNGTKEVVELARQMPKLKALVHVSTAYSNCPREVIEEKVYDSLVRYEDVKSVIEKLSEEETELITPRIIGSWPNTYTFTKALAESLIKDIGENLPIAIFRPSIVVSTYREPIEGWIDNLYGPTGVCAGAVSGVLRVSFCSQDKTADMVPVDTCVAGLIATAWDVYNKNQNSSEISVYNYVSAPENPITWQEMIEMNIIHGKKYPSMNSMWTSFVIFTNNFVTYWFLSLFLHIIPAFLLDTIAVLTGNKPRMLRIYKKIHKFTVVLSYFSTKSWTFSNKNVQNLWEKLDAKDKEEFPFSLKTVHWLIYFKGYLRGIRKYLLNDPESTLDAARKKQKIFNAFNTIFKYFFVYLLYKFIFQCMSSVIGAILS